MLSRYYASRPLYVAISMHPQRHSDDAFAQYHWALVVGPMVETPFSKGTRYHLTFVREGNGWTPRIEKDYISLGMGSDLVVRAKLGRLTKIQDLERIITGIHTDDLAEPSCETWVSRVIFALHRRQDIMRKRFEDWYLIRAWALSGAERIIHGFKTDVGYNGIIDLTKRKRTLPDQRYFSVTPAAMMIGKSLADDISSALSISSLSSELKKQNLEIYHQEQIGKDMGVGVW